MPSLEEHLRDQLAHHDWQAVTSIVAVSGGADSVALLRMLHSLVGRRKNRCIVAHFHHGLRGEAADQDARFVEALARQHGFEFALGKTVEDLVLQGDSLEAAARDARYQFLERTANSRGARYVFTAHTADDQAETILHRVLRGTGLDGLAGIPRVRALSSLTTIVRPLLDVRRSQIVDYLQAIGQDYRDDHTNADLAFTRNRLRHELLPHLAETYNPHVIDALNRLGELAGEAQAALREDVRALHLRAVNEGAAVTTLSTHVLRDAPAVHVRQLFVELWQAHQWPLQAMSFHKWRELVSLAMSSSDGTLNLPGAIRAKKQGEQLTLTRPEKL